MGSRFARLLKVSSWCGGWGRRVRRHRDPRAVRHCGSGLVTDRTRPPPPNKPGADAPGHDAKIPTLALPVAIAPKAIYTVTILHNTPNPEGAGKFVAYLLGSAGQNLLKQHQQVHISGDASAVPQNIKAITDGAK